MKHELRSKCAGCGCLWGDIETKNGQDVVRCDCCGAFQYNAPRVETGRAVRTLASRPTITPGRRARIFDAWGNACMLCGRRPPDVELQVGHVISREAAERAGVLDELIDSDLNLAPQCAECNSGDRTLQRVGARHIRLMHRALVIAARLQDEELSA